MSLASLVRNMVAVANDVTRDLQMPVTHLAWIGEDGYGDPTYDVATLGADGGPLMAVVEQALQQHRLPTGQAVETKAHLVFVQPVPPNGTSGRQEPFDTRDSITLPDGTTGPIVDIKGPYDPGTGRPFITEVWLGVGA